MSHNPIRGIYGDYCEVCSHHLSDADNCYIDSCSYRRKPFTQKETVDAVLREENQAVGRASSPVTVVTLNKAIRKTRRSAALRRVKEGKARIAQHPDWNASESAKIAPSIPADESAATHPLRELGDYSLSEQMIIMQWMDRGAARERARWGIPESLNVQEELLIHSAVQREVKELPDASDGKKTYSNFGAWRD